MNIDLHFQKQLIEEIRKCSRNGIKSQGVSYNGMEYLKKGFVNINDGKIATAIMFTVFINNEKSLKYYQMLFKIRNTWTCTWLIIIEKAINFDCEQPQGNPFNLQLNSVMLVKCGNSSRIKKYYSIFKNVTEVVELGTLTLDRKFVVNSSVELIQEKINLKGVILTQVGVMIILFSINLVVFP
jgi:hypothetical protein